MATTIAILNFKGGVGKTTTAFNLSEALRLKKKRVLLIDLDVQCNATYVSGWEVGDGDTICDALLSKTHVELPIYELKKNLSFIPSSAGLDEASEILIARTGKETILRRLLAPYQEIFDFIILDCPPNAGVINQNAMAAADKVIIPVDCEVFSLQGITNIQNKFNEIKEIINPQLEILGYLMTRYDERINMHRMAASTLRENYPDKVLNVKIRSCKALTYAQSQKMNIFDYDNSCHGAEDYEWLGREVIKRCKK